MNRRKFSQIGLTAGFGALIPAALAKTGFWNRKDPGSWTGEELLELTTASPWAKQVRGERRAGGSVTSRSASVAGAVAPGAGAPANARPGDDLGPVTAPTPLVTVRWESAALLRESLKTVFPPEFEGHYVISVGGLEGALDRIEGAELEARGREPIQSGMSRVPQRRGALMFAFSRELLPLTVADKAVEFRVRGDGYLVRARFEPKEMVYRGQLAV